MKWRAVPPRLLLMFYANNPPGIPSRFYARTGKVVAGGQPVLFGPLVWDALVASNIAVRQTC
jgi:hypothetical protein